MDIKKVAYLYLDMSKPLNRVLRRAVIFAVLTFIGQLITDLPGVLNPVYLPIVLAILGGLDKYLRENKDLPINSNMVK